MGHPPVNGRALPALALLACLVPAGGGLYRAGAIIWEGDFALRFAAEHVDKLPLLIHVLASITFIVLASIQLLPGTRHRHRDWHRKAGRVVFAAGMIGALSGAMMTLIHTGISSVYLYWGRLVFSLAWAAFLMLGLNAILNRRLPLHRAWMIRAYAVAINAGTLPFVYLPLVILFGEIAPVAEDWIQIIGWIINLSVAEVIIRRPARLHTQRGLA